jgi:hypothetical protein
MTVYADLHIHTYFSDGTQSPEEVVQIAKERGLSVISVCDHNTIAAYERLISACKKFGITLIQGVEMDVAYGDERLHILAYGFNPAYQPLINLIDNARHDYILINKSLIEDMEKIFTEVSAADYEIYESPLGRGGWKSINYLYDLGLSESVEEAMRYHKEYGQYQPSLANLDTACRIIREAGGVPVLAHPGVYWQKSGYPGKLQNDNSSVNNNADTLHEKLQKLLSDGIGGIECYYPWHNKAFTNQCVDFCKRNNLYITCGCDGHGDFVKVVMGCEYDIAVMKVDTALLRLPGLPGR